MSTIPSKSFSIWISTKPYSSDPDSKLTDEDFMYIGSNNSYPLNINYNSSTVGIMGQLPSTAVFVDGAGGAVMNINLNAERLDPLTYKGETSSTPPTPEFGDMWRVKAPEGEKTATIGGVGYLHGVFIAWNGSSWNNVHASPIVYSNKKFMEVMNKMRSKIQMSQNAYVLRVYNITQLSKKTYDTGGEALHNFRNSDKYKEVYVFIDTSEFTTDMSSPNEISVSLGLILRNKLKGYNE